MTYALRALRFPAFRAFRAAFCAFRAAFCAFRAFRAGRAVPAHGRRPTRRGRTGIRADIGLTTASANVSVLRTHGVR